MRYSAASIILHWIAALLLIVQVPLGLAMKDENASGAAHAMVGLSLLALTLIRIAARVTAPAPFLLNSLPPMDRMIAKATHVGLYALLVAAPLSGIAAWRMERPEEPIPIIGALSAEAPDTVLLAELTTEAAAPAAPTDPARAGLNAHAAIAFGLFGLVFLHLLAVAKHLVVDGINLFPRMGLGSDP